MKTNKCRKCREEAKTEITFHEENKISSEPERPLTRELIRQIVTGFNPEVIDEDSRKLYEEIMIDLNEVTDNDILENPDTPLYPEEMNIDFGVKGPSSKHRRLVGDMMKLMTYLSAIKDKTQFNLYQTSLNYTMDKNISFEEKTVSFAIIKLLDDSISIDSDKISINIDRIHVYLERINIPKSVYRKHMRHNTVAIREISHILASLPTTIKILSIALDTSDWMEEED